MIKHIGRVPVLLKWFLLLFTDMLLMTLYTSGIVCDDDRAAQQSVLPSSNLTPSFSYSNYPVDYPSIQRTAAHFVRVEIEEHPKNLERLPGRIQMKRFIPVEIFRKKGMPFQVLHFSVFTETTEIFFAICWITIARLHVQRKRKLYWYFVNGTTQSRSCFRWQEEKYQYHLSETLHRKFPCKW